MRIFLAAAAALSLLVQPTTLLALTNDDGLTSNIVALYRALKGEGHDVIVSVPCANGSGMGGPESRPPARSP